MSKCFAFNFILDSTYIYSLWELFYYEVSLIGYIAISIYISIVFVFKFDFKEGFIHIFVKCRFLNSFVALATNTQIFLQKGQYQTPPRNIADGTQNFCAVRTQPWLGYVYLFWLKTSIQKIVIQKMSWNPQVNKYHNYLYRCFQPI